MADEIWDKYFLDMAALAATKSKDPSTKVGAIIVGPDREIRSSGYNGQPRGADDAASERHERPEKYYWFEHAERNAIYNAARSGTSTLGCTLYVTPIHPCMDCARGIVQAGIVEVVVPLADGHERWAHHTERRRKLFEETGVVFRMVERRPHEV